MSDHIEAIITGLENCCSECADQAEHIAYAINEHAEVIITTQADDAAHDAAVAAKALRGVARALDAEDSNEWADAADQEAVRIIRLIRDEADRIEREGGGDV